MKVTMESIAQAVGVSQPVVSAVLNNRSYCRVSQEKRDAIFALAKELNYRPNSSARRLRGKKTDTIAIFTSRNCSSLQNEILRTMIGLLQASHLHSYAVVVDDEKELDEKLLDMQALGIDGFIGFYLDFDLQTDKWPLPSVNVGVQRRNPDVAADIFQGAKMLCSHLLQHGRSRITFLCNTLDSNCDKFAGIEEAIREQGRSDVTLSCLEFADNLAIVDDILAAVREGKCDAFMASNDSVAGCLMNVLLRAGITVPDQVAVTGFDGLALGVMTPLTLTTVVQSPGRIAEESVRLLRERLENKACKCRALLPVSLRIGESCGCSVPFESDFFWEFLPSVLEEKVATVAAKAEKSGTF